MAKITIAGDAVVITSELTLEQLRILEKFRPDALTLWGGDDGKTPVFAVGTTMGAGSVSPVGFSFGRETRDERKLATLTFCLPPCVENAREYVVEEYGDALANLRGLEAALPAVLAEIEDKKASVRADIFMAQ